MSAFRAGSMSLVRAGLLAGAIGAVILTLISLCSLAAPRIGQAIACLVTLFDLALYVAMGALAAHWLQTPRTASRGLGAGALAGLVMGLITIVLTVIRLLSLGATALAAQLPPEVLRQLRESGIAPRSLVVALLALTVICVPLLTIGLSAIGGLLYAVINPGQAPTPAASAGPSV